ncbi:MAG: hypothetical protein ACJAVW_001672, partial [Spirosomataceae bacterium]
MTNPHASYEKYTFTIIRRLSGQCPKIYGGRN